MLNEPTDFQNIDFQNIADLVGAVFDRDALMFSFSDLNMHLLVESVVFDLDEEDKSEVVGDEVEGVPYIQVAVVFGDGTDMLTFSQDIRVAIARCLETAFLVLEKTHPVEVQARKPGLSSLMESVS